MKNTLCALRKGTVLAFFLLFLAGSLADTSHAQTVTPASAAKVTPVENAGPDPSAIDPDVSACQDFYQYACGNWMKSHSIPPDQSWWGRFSDFFSDNDLLLRTIMEDSATTDVEHLKTAKLVRDYYSSCMNEPEIDKRQSDQLARELRTIASFNSRNDLARMLAGLHSTGVQVLFTVRSRKAPSGNQNQIAEVDSGGLTLPDRDYYLRNSAEMSALREKFVQHLVKMFRLAGDREGAAHKEADAVLKIETELARAAMEHSARRNPNNLTHDMDVKELGELVPAVSWRDYFKELGIAPIDRLNVTEPDFFRSLNTLLQNGSKEEIRSYLRWQVIDFFAPVMTGDFAVQNFNFRDKLLNGRTEIAPRWKRCVQLVNEQLGDAVGQLYVARFLQPGGKAQVVKIMEAEKAALLGDIQTSPWMSDETKRNAVTKLQAMGERIGYPEHWRDYSSLRISRDNVFDSYVNASRFVTNKQLSKVGKPQSNTEWSMSPQTIDASYNPEENTMNFPAGILRPPFYSNSAELEVNFAAIGAVIGHELTHGFDDEGRKFDLRGNLHDWWTPIDSSHFEEREACFVKEYSGFEVLPGLMANGKLTVGENIADNGGLRIAYAAWASTQKAGGQTKPQASDGFSPAQRFFLTYAQLWCQNMREPYIRQRTLNNEHSLGPYRVNGVVQNIPEFSDAFSCKPGDKMVNPSACRIW